MESMAAHLKMAIKFQAGPKKGDPPIRELVPDAEGNMRVMLEILEAIERLEKAITDLPVL